MSHHSEEALFTPGTDSFWEPGNYKRTVKRTEDGFRLCNDLIQLITERAEIEKVYAKNLKTWTKKWAELIEKGPEYGTAEAAWKSVLEEADRRSDIHLSVKDKLLNDVVASIKQWQKDSYHKSMMHIKEKKEFEDNFKKAQKPWAKLLDKVTRAKQDYHQACKNERSAINQERNASGDTSLSPDQVKKLQERVVKCKEEVQKTREKYEGSLRELSDYNSKYQDDMTEVFEKCQEFEEKRLVFFQDTFFSIHNCLNIASDPNLATIYDDFKQVINNADASKDLKWWSQNHGIGMPVNWPTFEEYTPDLHNISKKERKIVNQMINHDSVTLTNHVRHDISGIPPPPGSHLAHHGSGFHHPPPHVQIHSINNHAHHLTYTNYSNNKSNGKTATTTSSSSTSSSSAGSANNSLDPSCVSKRHSSHSSTVTATNNHHNNHHHSNTKYAHHSSNGSSASASNTAPTTVAIINNSTNSEKHCESAPHHPTSMVESTPFDDDHEDWDDYPKDALVDNGEPGVPVRALYDYEGAESDELSFKQGDEFEKLEDEDEQGWCKGRKDGRVGLYPANYVEPIPLPQPVK